MAYWLFKQEPTCYPYSALVQDGETNWDGVSNALAQKYLRACQPGDQVLYYHTGADKAIVGVMEVVADPVPHPENEKHVMVKVKPLKAFAKPVTLAEIKADPAFAEWELVRIGRLSVMPVPAVLWKKILKMGQSTK